MVNGEVLDEGNEGEQRKNEGGLEESGRRIAGEWKESGWRIQWKESGWRIQWKESGWRIQWRESGNRVGLMN